MEREFATAEDTEPRTIRVIVHVNVHNTGLTRHAKLIIHNQEASRANGEPPRASTPRVFSSPQLKPIADERCAVRNVESRVACTRHTRVYEENGH